MIDRILEMRLACDIDNMCHWHPLQWSRLWIVHPPPSPGSSLPSLFCKVSFPKLTGSLFCTDQILQSATSHILPHLLPPILSFNRFNPGSTLPQQTSESDVSVYQQSWAVSSVKQSISRVEQCIKLISTCLHQRLSPSLHRSSRHPSPTFIVNFLQVCKNRILSWWINLPSLGSIVKSIGSL